MSNEITVENRDRHLTRGQLRELREEGMVPGVVYGKDIKNSPILVDMKELLALLKDNSRSVLEMNLPQEGTIPVMVEEVQRDHINRTLLHIDFHQITMTDPIRTNVRVELIGKPEGVAEGAMLQILKNEVEIKCLPQQLPSEITAVINHLQVGDSLLAGDLAIPEGVELLTDGHEVIATILAVKPVSEEEKLAMEEETPRAEQPGQGQEKEKSSV